MKLWPVLVMCLLLPLSSAFAFDYDQYKQGDLDKILATPKIKAGIKMVVPQKLTFRVVLASASLNCNTDILKRAMVMQGEKKEVVDKLAISKCIGVKSAKNVAASLFIEDKVAERLSREAKPGEVVDLFSEFLYLGTQGPAFLVREFKKLK